MYDKMAISAYILKIVQNDPFLKFLEKFIPNIDNEHAQDYSCPGATFAFCSHGEKLPRQGGLPGVVQRVNRLSKLPRGNEKLM